MNFLIVYVFFMLTIAFHEFAHAVVAKRQKHKIGFIHIGIGPVIYQGKSIVIHTIPVYGYVEIFPDNQRSSPKFLTLFAGSVANILLALFLSMLALFIGIRGLVPTVTSSDFGTRVVQSISNKPIHERSQIEDQLLLDFILGKNSQVRLEDRLLTINWAEEFLNHPDELKKMLPFNISRSKFPCIIDRIIPQSPSSQSGLKSGDVITHLNQHKIVHCSDFLVEVRKSPFQTIQVQTQDSVEDISLDSKWVFPARWAGYAGIVFKVPKQDESELKWLQVKSSQLLLVALSELWSTLYSMFVMMYGLMIGKISINILTSPLAIFSTPLSILKDHLYGNLMIYFAKLNIIFGILNLLPIPGLDGGIIVLRVAEFFKKKPFKPHLINLFNQLALIFFFVIFFHITINDSLRYMYE